MPSIASLEAEQGAAQVVPILGDSNNSALEPDSSNQPFGWSTMKPQINAIGEAGSDLSASPMTEVVDNHALDIDPFKLTETVGRSRSGENEQRQQRLLAGQNGEKGVIGELFSGMVDDLLGGSKAAPASRAAAK